MPRQPPGIRNLLVGASSGITISILLGATGIAIVGGNLDAIQAWDEPWRTLFWVFFGLLILFLAARLGLIIAAWLMKVPVTDAVMVPGDQPFRPTGASQRGSTGVLDSTPEELIEMGNALRALSEDLINLLFDYQPTPAMAMPPEKEPELAERYQTDFAYRVVHLYEEARRRGFGDPEIENTFLMPTAYRSLAPLAWRFGAMAERVLDRAKG
jgi:hypothetical protein